MSKKEAEIGGRRSDKKKKKKVDVLSSSCCLKFIRRSVYLLKIRDPPPPFHSRATLERRRDESPCFIAENKIIGCTFLALTARLFLSSTRGLTATTNRHDTARHDTTRHGCAHTRNQPESFLRAARFKKRPAAVADTLARREPTQRGRLICWYRAVYLRNLHNAPFLSRG